MYMYADIFVAR